jgi:hypothetical protein
MTGGKAIFSKLTGDSTVAALVGTRVVPETGLLGDANFPQVIYRATDDESLSESYGSAGSLVATTYEVASTARTHAGAVALSLAVRAALDRQTGVWGGITVLGCFEQDGGASDTENVSAGPGGLVYVVEHEYRLVYRTS